jgi:hypothetical protein
MILLNTQYYCRSADRDYLNNLAYSPYIPVFSLFTNAQ